MTFTLGLPLFTVLLPPSYKVCTSLYFVHPQSTVYLILGVDGIGYHHTNSICIGVTIPSVVTSYFDNQRQLIFEWEMWVV